MVKTLLFISPVIPTPSNRGSVLRTAMNIKLLQELGFKITILILNRSEEKTSSKEIEERCAVEFPGSKVHVRKHPYFLKRSKKPNEIKAYRNYRIRLALESLILRRWKITNEFESPTNFRKFIKKELKSKKYQYVFFNYTKMYLPRPRSANYEDIIDMHDLQYNRIRNDEMHKWPFYIRNLRYLIFKRSEISLLRKAKKLIAISNIEKETLEKFFSNKRKIDLLPVISPNSKYEIYNGNELSNYLFIGSNSDSNAASLVWFLTYCWLDIRKVIPNIRLFIAGRVCFNRNVRKTINDLELASKGLRICNEVNDLSELYASCGIIIAPNISGTGMKVKVIEALSYAKIIVGTKIAFEGINVKHNFNAYIANTPKSFIKSCIKASTNNKNLTMKINAYKLWNKDHSYLSGIKILKKFFKIK